MATLKQIKAKSKKTGKDYVAYRFVLGEWQSPMFFVNNDYEKQAMLYSAEQEGLTYDGD